MADVFLSYAREDRRRVKPLAHELLARDYSVWWDNHLVAGESWARKIKAHHDAAKCVVVVWTRNSVDDGRTYKSDWVENEADEGHRRGVLVPALQDSGCVAWTHQKVHYAAMEGWLGETNCRGLTELFDGIAQHVLPYAVEEDAENQSEVNAEIELADHEDNSSEGVVSDFSEDSPPSPAAPLVAAPRDAREERKADEAPGEKATSVHLPHHGSADALECDLFAPSALRAIVCGVAAGPLRDAVSKPSLAVIGAGRMFIIDAGAGAGIALESHRIPLGRLEAVLLTGADPVRASDLNELFVDYATAHPEGVLPVYGPTDSHDVVRGVNATLVAQKMRPGLQPWAPRPRAGQAGDRV